MPNKEYYIQRCLDLKDNYVNRALSYVLKYLPNNVAVKYFEKLSQTSDSITQIILFNEIPLLSMKHRDTPIIDDLQQVSSDIIPSRTKIFYDIARRNATPEAIEHLASYVHLIPKEYFKEYYTDLSNIKNKDLQDRLIYKLTNLSRDEKMFAIKELAPKIEDNFHRMKLILATGTLPNDFKSEIENILGISYEEAKKYMENYVIK